MFLLFFQSEPHPIFLVYEDNMYITHYTAPSVQTAVLILASCEGMDRITMHRDLTDIFVVDKNIM